MGKGTKPRVNANGKLVLPGGEVTSSNEQSTSASISDGGGGSSPCSALRSTRTVDFFGFNLDIRKLLTALAVAYFIMGPGGTFALLTVWGAYIMFSRVTSSSSSRSRSSGSSSRTGSGGGGGGGGGRSNIRGMADLPCDPVRG